MFFFCDLDLSWQCTILTSYRLSDRFKCAQCTRVWIRSWKCKRVVACSTWMKSPSRHRTCNSGGDSSTRHLRHRSTRSTCKCSDRVLRRRTSHTTRSNGSWRSRRICRTVHSCRSRSRCPTNWRRSFSQVRSATHSHTTSDSPSSATWTRSPIQRKPLSFARMSAKCTHPSSIRLDAESHSPTISLPHLSSQTSEQSPSTQYIQTINILLFNYHPNLANIRHLIHTSISILKLSLIFLQQDRRWHWREGRRSIVRKQEPVVCGVNG